MPARPRGRRRVGAAAQPHGFRLRAQRRPHGRLDPGIAGDDFELPYILEPLKPLKASLTVHTGLACDKAAAAWRWSRRPCPVAGGLSDRTRPKKRTAPTSR